MDMIRQCAFDLLGTQPIIIMAGNIKAQRFTKLLRGSAWSRVIALGRGHAYMVRIPSGGSRISRRGGEVVVQSVHAKF